jgi:hypothetical protein
VKLAITVSLLAVSILFHAFARRYSLSVVSVRELGPYDAVQVFRIDHLTGQITRVTNH